MCPDSLMHRRTSFQKQRGYLMPLAIFIVLVMGGMALTIARYTGQSSTASVQEVMTVRAFYAAESGAQYAMNRVLYDASNPITQVNAQSNCDGLSAALTYDALGLHTCRANLSCSYDVVSTASYFSITSVGVCGTGPITARRTVRVSSFLE